MGCKSNNNNNNEYYYCVIIRRIKILFNNISENRYLIDTEYLKEYWKDFLNNKNNNYKYFWNLIVFFNWIKNK